MAKRQKAVIGKYRKDEFTGEAVVTLQSPEGRRKTYVLGEWQSHTSVVAHEKLTQRWKRNGRVLPDEVLDVDTAEFETSGTLSQLCHAWPTLRPEVKGMIIFIARLNKDIAKMAADIANERRTTTEETSEQYQTQQLAGEPLSQAIRDDAAAIAKYKQEHNIAI